jgi:hypothetical protein
MNKAVQQLQKSQKSLDVKNTHSIECTFSTSISQGDFMIYNIKVDSIG